MVSAALWEQVESLSLRERIELRTRLDETIRRPLPLPGIPSTIEGLRASLVESRQHVAKHPETVMTAAEAMNRLRARHRG
ncbi:MAG: hypothetical protein LBK72_05530 [Bifidobacteriaceae bacterium]|nr:hypothetical protein [Bifidobacteriaceae bacterium]